MAATLVTQYASSGAADPHVISLSGKTNGRDLFVVAAGPAIITASSPWVAIGTGNLLHTSGNWSVSTWRLPAADNTSGVTTLSLDLNATTALAAIVWEDDLDTGVTPYFDWRDDTPGTYTSQPAGSPAIQGTGLHTFTTKEQTFAIFAILHQTGTPDIASYDESYTDFADSGGGVGSSLEIPHIWIASRTNHSFTSGGVSATYTGAASSFASSTGMAGMYAYDQGAAAPTGPYVAAGAAATAASGNVTPILPAGLATDDALILEITALDNVSCSVATSGGSGNAWTQKTAHNNGTGLRQEIWWKRRGSGDADTHAAVTHTAGGKIIARVHAIRVPGTGDPFEATGGPTSVAAATTGAFPNVTTLTDDAFLFYAFSYAEDFTTGPSITSAEGLTITERDETEVT